jgi:spermidine dehydrogenase
MAGASMTAPGLMASLGFEKRSAFLEEPYIFHFPDGNATIARLLVRALIDGVATGKTMEDIAAERFDYAALDRPEQQVRLRLNSTVISARNTGTGSTIAYVREGKPFAVRSKATVLACWHSVIPYVCPELPERQKAAMHACVKVPIVYVGVQIRNWRALQSTGVGYAYCPGAYFSEVGLDYPVSLGKYRFGDQPDDSCILQLVRTPCAPGLPARDQFRAGRAELYATPFSTFEERIKDQLDRMFGAGGFKSDRDIMAITVNRWAHAYTYYHHTLWDGDVPEEARIHVVSRKRFGNIAIANTDAGGDAQVPFAIEQAYRATRELLDEAP